MLAQQEGIDFVAYARPGAEQPESVGSWSGCRTTRVDEIEPMGDGRSEVHQTGWIFTMAQTQDADRRALWRSRHDPRPVAGPEPPILEENVGPMAVVVQDKTNRAASQKSHHGVEFSARELVELYGLKREHIRVIPNGVSKDFVTTSG